jgi:hypothetical protein
MYSPTIHSPDWSTSCPARIKVCCSQEAIIQAMESKEREGTAESRLMKSKETLLNSKPS